MNTKSKRMSQPEIPFFFSVLLRWLSVATIGFDSTTFSLALGGGES